MTRVGSEVRAKNRSSKGGGWSAVRINTKVGHAVISVSLGRVVFHGQRLYNQSRIGSGDADVTVRPRLGGQQQRQRPIHNSVAIMATTWSLTRARHGVVVLCGRGLGYGNGREK